MDGTSLRSLISQNAYRNLFYAEAIDAFADTAPDFRTVRSKEYKYTYYACDQVTEEFFDLANDPHELHNLIFDASYQSLVSDYLLKLDSFRVALDDTLAYNGIDCYTTLSRQSVLNQLHLGNPVELFPNPADNRVELLNTGEEELHSIRIFSADGKKVSDISVPDHSDPAWLNVSTLNDGLYLVIITVNKGSYFRKLLLQH